MTITADGQQLPRVRRRRRKDDLDSESPSLGHPIPSRPMDEDASTFFQMEEEAEKLAHITHECPIPKPKGALAAKVNSSGHLEHSPSTIAATMSWVAFIRSVLTQPQHTKWIAPLLILSDMALCALVIWKVSYTEIDWTTYMQQISLYASGERDYTAIKGSTGPLVYPAAHVYIYNLLYHLTDAGRDIYTGQILFAALYMLALVIVVACYRQLQVPPYIFPLLVLSKRLHSIFMLRMFNDGIAAFAMWIALYLFLEKKWTAGVAIWSVGVGVKMTLVLLAPAVAIILLLSVGLKRSVGLGTMAALIQILLAIPFLYINATGYLSRAFELSRQFMFKWTVNWRFIGEESFLSKEFSIGLLVLHVSILAIFAFGWVKPSGSNPFRFLQHTLQGHQGNVELSKLFIMTTILSSLAIGLLCARSLHYQFFAYLAWASPFLLWRAGLHPVIIYSAWVLQEWAWNVYPSTNTSSAAVVFSLALQVFGVLFNRHAEVGNKGDRADNVQKTRTQ
ncbi:hypothetical protein N7495_005211 [Penicillium taxi]|uniref:uncharacterized protein n=1 Tax=Penicillium taxi TaxID=168475 RepID=UPI0025457448|nr:uncharacterized protein N7495_005211 [Penicillium taxi]KAJ5893520.1 hypothetical protein N7495_005211 [Penicillium taxi]